MRVVVTTTSLSAPSAAVAGGDRTARRGESARTGRCRYPLLAQLASSMAHRTGNSPLARRLDSGANCVCRALEGPGRWPRRLAAGPFGRPLGVEGRVELRVVVGGHQQGLGHGG